MPIDRLPPKVKPYAERLRSLAITDVPVMLLMGAISMITGIAYVINPPDQPFHPLENLTYTGFFGILWIVSASFIFVSCLFPRTFFASASLGVGILMYFVWSGSLVTEFFNDFRFSLLARGLQYAGIALLALYSVWIKSAILEMMVVPSRKEVDDVLRGDPS